MDAKTKLVAHDVAIHLSFSLRACVCTGVAIFAKTAKDKKLTTAEARDHRDRFGTDSRFAARPLCRLGLVWFEAQKDRRHEKTKRM